MINELIRQLQDPNPEVRKSAIMALGKSKDSAALKPLALVVRGDPDPALRELALKAGQYIRQQMQQQTRPRAVPFVDAPPEEPRPPATLRFQQMIEEEGRKQVEALPDPSFDEYLIPEDAPPVPEKEELTLDEAPPRPPHTPVPGRNYRVGKDDKDRAKQYLDAALSLNIGGDNAKAMKNLTEALSLNPNLINDPYFNNIAASVTGLDSDAANQMIIDRHQRKQFTETAAQKQKNRRVEQHLNEAQQASWTDVGWEVTLCALIVIIGPILAILVTNESIRNLLSQNPQMSDEMLAALQSAQTAFASTLLTIGIVSSISSVISLLLQTVLIHFSAGMLGGTGTWRNLIRVLLGFYNKWLPIIFFVFYITIAVTFFSQFSPVALCFVLALVLMTLYVSGKTSGKVGEAYDFGVAKGCLSLTISLLVILLINAGISYLMVQTLGLAFSQLPTG